MEILQSISLDFARNTLPIKIFAKQYDQKTRYIEITPLKFGQPYAIENGVTVRLQLTKPDKTTVISDATITDNIIKAELSYQSTAVAGIVTAEIGLYKNDSLLSSQVFYIDVEKSAYDANAVKSSNEYNLFIDALDRVEPAVTASENAIKNAETALATASKAADAANTAKINADNSATAANAARIEAEKAAQNANTAADLATTAANSADEATDNANMAAVSANAAAERIESAIKATDESTAKADTATENANAAAESAQTLTAVITEKLEKGDFIGAQGKQGIQGEKGEDGFSPTISITPLDNGHTVSITDIDGEKSFNVLDGKQGVPGNDYILTDEDKKEIADLAVDNAAQAADKANAAAQAAQDVIDYVNQKLADGDFNGADYILTAADKTEIANLVTPLAESMRGGTVTYEIPKEYYEGEFLAFDRNNAIDPNKTGLSIYIPSVTFSLAKITLDDRKFEEDLSAGLIEEPSEEIFQLPIDEQVPILEEFYKDYMTISQNPWCPKTIKPLLYYALMPAQLSLMQQVFRNPIETRIVIKREDSEERTVVVANPCFTAISTETSNLFAPVILLNNYYNEEEEKSTLELVMWIMGGCPKYSSDSKYATANDTIEEVTFTFIPNNTFVEADNNESV